MPRPDRSHRQREFEREFHERDTFSAPHIPSRGPSPRMAASGPERQGVVKWFNRTKGFGFVEMSDGSGDVFLHSSALAPLGLDGVGEGATLRVRLGQGPKGMQVAEVVHVDESTAAPGGGFGAGGPRGRSDRGADRGFGRDMGRGDMGAATETSGTVKWFNAEKGFGFITPASGGKDVFVHVSVLKRSGLETLNEGQTVNVQVVQGAKGPEARSVEPA